MKIASLIKNSSIVLAIYGEWPSFHDAQLTSLSFEFVGPSTPWCCASLHTFRTIDNDGQIVPRPIQDHPLIHFEFRQLTIEQLPEFDRCFDLLSLTIEPSSRGDKTIDGFRVSLLPAAGVEGLFCCQEVEVLNVEGVQR